MPPPLDLAKLYDDHAQSLFAFLLNFTRNEDDTCDVLQELFCKLAARPELLRGVKQPRAFLIHLAHNIAVDFRGAVEFGRPRISRGVDQGVGRAAFGTASHRPSQALGGLDL